jgi:hypothetical protein
MADNRSIESARKSLVRALDKALADIGERLSDLGASLLDDDRDAEVRAAYLFSDDAREVWAGIWQGDVADLKGAIKEFDTVVRDSENGEAHYRILMDNTNFEGERGIDKLENLRGIPAAVKRYLEKAGFKITVVQEGMYAVLVCTR